VTLAGVQSERDTREIGLDEVGVNGLRYPISVFDAERGSQSTVATVALSVALPPEDKGSHLSRFVEILDSCAGEISPKSIPRILALLQSRLRSTNSRVEMTFPFFVRRSAPITGAEALLDYTCGITGWARGERIGLSVKVCVPVTSVCPCSKAISDYGAHNQRGTVTIEAALRLDPDTEISPLWMEDLIKVAEASGSSPVFPLLKRADERHVTMLGFDHPVFVEDMVREVTDQLRHDPRIERFSVAAVNEESIHNHGAFAKVEWPPTAEEGSDRW
jgi:GTP cyclohydrolase IB